MQECTERISQEESSWCQQIQNEERDQAICVPLQQQLGKKLKLVV